jgi:choline dehydrogenase-like flavoprotein
MAIYTLSERAGNEVVADVCVIGAGIAGLFAATRLARSGKRIVVVESGGRTFDPQLHSLNEVDNAFNTYAGAVNGRFRGLGGTSTQWAGRLLPLTAHDIGDRPYLGVSAWPIEVEELNRYRSEIERVFEVDPGSFEEDILDQIDRRRLAPRNDSDFALRYPKWPDFKKCNVAHQFRAEIERAENLDICLEATVTGFELDPGTGRLTSVSAADLGGRKLRVKSSEFLIAGGTIEATRLLLLLDATFKGRVFAGCKVLGRYFQDHLGAKVGELRLTDRGLANCILGYHFIGSTRRSLHIEMSPAVQQAEQVASGFAQILMSVPETSPLHSIKKVFRGFQRGEFTLDRQDVLRVLRDPMSILHGTFWRYIRNQLHWPGNITLDLHVWIEQLPHWKNQITLSEKRDRLGVPMARIEWSKTDSDERTFQACMARLDAFWKRNILSQTSSISWLPGARDGSVPVIDRAVDVMHPSGSTLMGLDPTKSVVGPDMRTHQVENLSVASASAFPTAGSANPTYTIIQLALRAADAVMKRLS